jgi:hypothetical protein
MQGRIFNFVSVSAAVGILFLFATLWNLQSRDILYTHLEEFEKVTPTQNATVPEDVLADNAEIAEPTAGATRPSFLEIATKWGTDKVTVHHYNYSRFSRSLEGFNSNTTLSVRKIPGANS